MFLLVLVACVTLEGQTMCHEFEREQVFANHDSCMMAAALEKGHSSSRMERRNWAPRNWECRNNANKKI